MSKEFVHLMKGLIFLTGKKGAYTESISIGSIQIQILTPFPKKLLLFSGSLSRPVKADIVKEHLARSAGDRHVAFCAKANRNLINIG